jgi:Protein of unknown function (DUF2934)
MPAPDDSADRTIRETAYFIWEHEGRPDGRARDHWLQAVAGLAAQRGQNDERMEDEEKILAGRSDANMPALLTRDVPGG